MFNYKKDKIPVLLITIYFLIDVFVYINVENIYILVIWFLVGIFPKANICAWNHHHQHVKTFKFSFLNRILELIYAFHTGITANTWVLHHNFGHHINYLDQDKDESRWKSKDGKTMNVFRYTFEVAFTSYSRAFVVGKKHLKERSVFIYMFIITILLLGGLIYYKPIQGILVFALPMVVSLIITAYATYSHHVDLSLEEPKHASRNIESKWYNIITGNLGYHTAHHIRFGWHWSKLPELHQKIKAEIPKECIVNASAIFLLFDKMDLAIRGPKSIS